MSSRALALLVGICLAGLGSARAEPAGGVTFQVVRFQGVDFDIVTVNLDKASLRLIREDEKGTLPTLEALRDSLARHGEKLLAATNSGIFEPGAVPTGLFVQDGKTLAPLNLKHGQGNFYLEPNGVFFIGPRGAAVVESSAFPGVAKDVLQATQSGPLLVRSGAIHHALNPNGTSTAIRSGVGVRDPRHVVIAISEGQVNLWTFAELFRRELGCSDALYLDGAISRLYAPALRRSELYPKQEFGGFLAVISR